MEPGAGSVDERDDIAVAGEPTERDRAIRAIASGLALGAALAFLARRKRS